MKKGFSKIVATILLATTLVGTMSVSSMAAPHAGKPEKFNHIGDPCYGVPGVIDPWIIVGSPNMDRIIEQADVNYLLKFLNKRDMCSFTERYITGFDIEGHHYTPLQINNFDFIKEMDIDGNKKINQYDATLLAQYVDWKKETNFNDGFNRQQW